MADIYGSNYEKEWVLDPSEQAAKGSRNAHIKCQLEEASGIAAADEVYLHKLQNKAVFLGLEDLVGASGAGGLTAVDKDGNSVAIAVGDELDGQIDGGLDIILTADGATSASIKVLLKFLMD